MAGDNWTLIVLKKFYNYANSVQDKDHPTSSHWSVNRSCVENTSMWFLFQNTEQKDGNPRFVCSYFDFVGRPSNSDRDLPSPHCSRPGLKKTHPFWIILLSLFAETFARGGPAAFVFQRHRFRSFRARHRSIRPLADEGAPQSGRSSGPVSRGFVLFSFVWFVWTVGRSLWA